MTIILAWRTIQIITWTIVLLRSLGLITKWTESLVGLNVRGKGTIIAIHNRAVPISEGMQAYQAAQIKGIPSKFLYFPEEGHWVLSPQNGLVWHREFFGWLDQWLKK